MLRLRVLLPLAIVSLVACKKETTDLSGPVARVAPSGTNPAAPPPAATPGATGSGSIAGTVKLTGTPPEMPLTKRQADPFCARTPMKEEEVIAGPNGGLKNVVVRITKGA